MSTIDPALPPLRPTYTPSAPDPASEPPATASLIRALSLQPHVEGGYFAETDRDARLVPNPFLRGAAAAAAADGERGRGTKDREAAREEKKRLGEDGGGGGGGGGEGERARGDEEGEGEGEGEDRFRNASTSIFYLLTPGAPQGGFHRNSGRTVHALHRGRGRYVVIHADEAERDAGTAKARVETFAVGPDVGRGERLQWVVAGGKYKASFLVPEPGGAGEEGSGGLLISEVRVALASSLSRGVGVGEDGCGVRGVSGRGGLGCGLTMGAVDCHPGLRLSGP